MMKRVMCVYLPKLSLQRLEHERPELRDEPAALSRLGPRGSFVVDCSERALRAGARPNMPVTEALAIERRLKVWEEDPERDLRALEKLAVWAGRYSPIVGLEEEPFPQSLLLDITGCAACFHGEEEILRRAAHELTQKSWSACMAIADTVGAAWALAHFARTPCLVPPGEVEKFLTPLPVTALRLPAEAVRTLSRLGIEHVGRLLELERSSIPGRFGLTILQRLDQALGRLPEVILPYHALPEASALYPFAYATDRLESLRQAVRSLAVQIHDLLQNRHQGARRLECWLYFEAALPLCIQVGLFQPSLAAEHIERLICTRLERTRVVHPVSAVRLRVALAEALADSQADFLETEYSRELSVLLDGLSSRLGPEAVTRVQIVPDAQPEYACRFESVLARGDPSGPKSARRSAARDALPDPAHRDRPLRLWPTPPAIKVLSPVLDGAPRKFRWAGSEYRVVHATGPERIETGWWRGHDVRRDYYTVATHTGARFWIFRSRVDGRWFLHGCFD